MIFGSRVFGAPSAVFVFLWQAGLVALLWIVLFRLNNWFFSSLDHTANINWIFLPAAIRMFSVLVLSWPAVAGLFLGGIFTANLDSAEPVSSVLVLAVLSALGPWFAVRTCMYWLRLPQDLTGLSATNLAVMAIAGAFFNVVPHNLYFYFSGMTQGIFGGLIPMFVGDLIGSLLVLYSGALLLRLCSRYQ